VGKVMPKTPDGCPSVLQQSGAGANQIYWETWTEGSDWGTVFSELITLPLICIEHLAFIQFNSFSI
jgi:hypothetical protein